MYTHDNKNIFTKGKPLEETKKALILLHGRGGSASDILSLQQALRVDDFTLVAPEATRNSWYPFSFMAPDTQNQPALNSALEVLEEVVKNLMEKGVESKNIYFLGFSQGACLTLEYTSRNARQYGGIVAFTGGLIGETINESHYKGDFARTPVLLTTGDPDPHVPVTRVEESKRIMEELGADLTLKVYKGRAHTITQEEVELANSLIFKK